MYYWKAKSDDGAYEIDSRDEEKVFQTKKEAYEDMRNEALDKMKWNTEYDEDFNDCDVVNYSVEFSKDKIIHESFSGVYIYEIKKK